MKFFENYFDNTDFYNSGAEEVKVLCPFHSDTNPSASINIEKSLFHCWVCGVGYNEQQFISKINDISLLDASKVLNNLEGSSETNKWSVVSVANLWADDDMLNALYGLGLPKTLIEGMQLGKVEDKLGNPRLGIPVFYNKVLMDIRSYDLMKNSSIKMISGLNAESGFIIPYDEFIKADKEELVYIFEGEKDMLVARALGINAITLTGGASAIPNDMTINAFKDKKLVICYDNDKAGKDGADGLYLSIKNIANDVKYIDISEVVKEDKEDFSDAVLKYDMDVWTFLSLELKEFNDVKKDLTTIKDALDNNIIKRRLTSEVTVSGEF